MDANREREVHPMISIRYCWVGQVSPWNRVGWPFPAARKKTNKACCPTAAPRKPLGWVEYIGPRQLKSGGCHDGDNIRGRGCFLRPPTSHDVLETITLDSVCLEIRPSTRYQLTCGVEVLFCPRRRTGTLPETRSASLSRPCTDYRARCTLPIRGTCCISREQSAKK